MTKYSDEEMARGMEKLRRAEEWRNANPQAWGYLEGVAVERARNGQPISGRALVEAVREKAFVDRMGNDTKTNNDYAAIFARWIAKEHPEAARYIEHRATVFDLLVA